jgi:hypothetical protein
MVGVIVPMVETVGYGNCADPFEIPRLKPWAMFSDGSFAGCSKITTGFRCIFRYKS